MHFSCVRLLHKWELMSQSEQITAAVLVIGDEILSGRTQDANSAYIARFLSPWASTLRSPRRPRCARRDRCRVNALAPRYTYVFTTGGIGPTHDDITADAVAKAFGVGHRLSSRGPRLLLTRIKPEDMNEMRKRMARIPFGASLSRIAFRPRRDSSSKTSSSWPASR